MPINQFIYGATVVDFAQASLRESDDSAKLYQVQGLSSDGILYTYDKSVIFRVDYKPVYPQCNQTTLDLLLSLQADLTAVTPFTWYDHEGVSRSVRFAGEINWREITPGRFRIEIPLTEESAYAAAADTSLLSTYAAPCWILKVVINAVTYHLSDSIIVIPAWGITTLPWVNSWGTLQSGIDGSLGEYHVSDFNVSLLINRSAVPNIETLVTTYAVEGLATELYLYDCSGTVAPAKKFSGFIRDISIPDDTRVDQIIEDASSRLKTYIGRKLSLTDYPDADPKDVGKVLPIPYGVVKKVPLPAIVAGAVTSLPLSIDGTSTSVLVSDAAGLAVGSTIGIDVEQMYISAISGATLTVTRGYNATTAAEHNRSAKVVEYVQTIYMAADCAIGSIDKVWARINQADMLIYPVTGVTVEVYSGQAGSELAGYPGKALVRLPSAPVFVRQLLRAYPTLAGAIQDYSIQDPTHLHSLSGSMALPTQYASGTGVEASQSSGIPRVAANNLSFPAYPGTLVQQTIHFTISFSNAEAIYCDGVLIYSGIPWTGSTTYHRTTTGTGSNTSVEVRANSGTVTVTTTACTRDVLYTGAPVESSASGNSKSLANNGTISVSSVGNTAIVSLIPDLIMADVTHQHTVPAIFSDILSRAGMSNTTLTVIDGSAGSTTPVSGPELVVNGGFGSAASWSLGTPPAATELVVNGGFAIADSWSLMGVTATELVVNGGFGSAASWSLPLPPSAFGAELVTEGSFPNNSTTEWSRTGTIANNMYNASALPAYQQGLGQYAYYYAVPIGRYRVTFTIKNYSAGSIGVNHPGAGVTGISQYFSGNGTYTVDNVTTVAMTAGTGEFFIAFKAGSSGFTGSIDDVSMKSITLPFNITAGVVTGATTTASGVIAQQTGISLVNGWSYTATFQVVSATAGSCKLDIGGKYSSALQTAAGTYTLNFTANATESLSLSIIAGAAGFSGSVDNISCMRDTSGGTFTVTAGVVTGSTPTAAGVIATQTGIALVNGWSYTATFQVVTATAGSCKLDIGGKYTTALQTAAGTYTLNFTANATESLSLSIIAGAAGFSGSLDNISCIAAAGVLTISAGGLNIATPVQTVSQQSGIAITNNYGYTATFQIVSRTAGSCYINIGNKYISPAYSAPGTYTYTFTANATESLTISVIPSAGGFSGVVDSVSIQATSFITPAVPAIYTLASDTSLLNGVINEYRRADEWLNLLAFQLRAWFRYDLDQPTLYVRSDTLATSGSIPACKVSSDGRKIHSRRKTELVDILNKINLLFDRDWTLSGDTAYKQVLKVSDAGSITLYGERERPELFKFDFVTSPTLAQTVINFYLARYHDRHWIHEFELFLDQHALKFGDVKTLTFAGGKVVQIISAGAIPGDSEKIDSIKIRVIE